MRAIPILTTKEKLHNLETSRDLYRYRFDGWMIWTIFRFPIYFHMIEPFRFHREKKQLITKWVKRLIFALMDVPAFLFPPRRDCLVKTASTMRRELENGRYKDYFLDDYLFEKQPSFFKLEVMNRENFFSHSQKPLIASHMTTTLMDMLAFFASKVFKNHEIKQIATSLYNDISEEIGEWITSGEIEKMLASFYWEKRLYAYLIRRISPKYILLTNYFDYALIAAGKEAGIPVIEFQHGRTDWFFGPAVTESSNDYYSKLLVPDRIFLFGEFWKEQMAQCNGYRDQLCAVGSTTMDKYRQQKIASAPQKADNVCTLLLTTDFYRQELIDILASFLDMAKDKLNVHLMLKLHPSYDLDGEKYLDAFHHDERVSVHPGAEFPTTAELLTVSDFHLSVNSTCHYEALALQVPTIVVGVHNHEISLHIVENGHGFLANNAEELYEVVTQNWKKSTVPDEVSEWYYKSGALENISRELAKVAL